MLLWLLPWLLLEQRPADLTSAGRRSCEGGKVQAGRSWLHGLHQNHRASVVHGLSPRAAREVASLSAMAPGTPSPDLELMDSAPGQSGLCCAPLLGALLGDSHHVSCMHTCLPLNTHACPCTYILAHVHTHACPCTYTCLSMHMPTFQTPRCKGT